VRGREAFQQTMMHLKDALRLLYVSHYNYYRNFETLFHALPLMREQLRARKLQLFLTCRLRSEDNPGSYNAEAASALVGQLGVGDSVVELGAVPYSLLHHVYRACSVYVTPAYAESFAHPLVEAMASGLPVVASDLAVHREICQDAAIYFQRFSPAELAEQVCRVAANGQWWAVWSELVTGGQFFQTQLFQRHTLLGVQGRTRITNTAPNIADDQATLAYAGGRMTLVWTRSATFGGQQDLRIAESTGGAWLSRPFASLGASNSDPDVTVYASVTWVTWERDARIVVANNSGGTFHSRTFAGFGSNPTVAVSGSHAFVGWWAIDADRVVLAELSAGAWTSGQVDGPPTYPLRVLAQGTKARVIYRVPAIAIYIRTQT
jgi:hypothetical protein